VDVLIRCALRDRLANAAPSPAIWGRIVTGAERSRDLRFMLSRIGLRLESVGIFVFGMDVALPESAARAHRHSRTAILGHDLRWTWLNRHQVLRLVV
jgi:hypothetical protein